MESLRVYPLPYISFQIKDNHMDYVAGKIEKLRSDKPTLNRWMIKKTYDKMIVSIAFADIYGLESQFLKRKTTDFTFGKTPEFKYDKKGFKLVPSRINKKWENTGPRTEFRVSSKTLKTTSNHCIVLCAISLPSIQILGWVTRKDASSSIQGWSAKIHVNSPKLKSVLDMPVNPLRRKGMVI